MKKNILIVAGFILILAGALAIWFYPMYSPISQYIMKGCKPHKILLVKGKDAYNFDIAQKSFVACKAVLKKNDELISDKNWKSKSTKNLYNSFVTPSKYKNIKESGIILNQLVQDGVIMSAVDANFYHNEKAMDSTLDETIAIVEDYNSYNEITKTTSLLEKQREFLYQRCFKKHHKISRKPKKY